MGFSDKDKILIKNLHDSKEYLGYGAKKLIKSVPFKSWSKRELSCSVISSRDKYIVRMNWNGASLMSRARFMRSWTFDEATDQWRGRLWARVRAEGGACALAMLILSICVNCLTAASLIAKSCEQCWPIHSCSFYKVVQQQIWGLVVYFKYTWSQLISVCNSEKIY